MECLGAVFDNDIKFNEEETKKKITRLLLDAKNDWLYPVYNVIFKNLQDSKRNKEVGVGKSYVYIYARCFTSVWSPLVYRATSVILIYDSISYFY